MSVLVADAGSANSVLVADTVATAGSSETVVSVTASPSASRNATVTATAAPCVTITWPSGSTAGARFDVPVTVAANVAGSEVAFAAPLSSVAVTVIVAVPAATPATSISSPDTDTVATPRSVEFADTVCVSSASASVTPAVAVRVVPAASSMSPSAPTTGRLLVVTVTANVRAAEVASGPPLSSVAATVTVVLPRATPVIVSRVPDTATVAMDASAEDAATVCVSPASGSAMPGSNVTVSPTATVTAVTASTDGRLFGTVARNVSGADSALPAPLSSVAATVIVAVPRPTPRGYAYLPDVVTDATDVSSELADSVWASPASASETGTGTVCTAPFDTVRSAIAPTAGRLFGTVTWNVAGAEAAFDAPLSSVAVTDTVAVPRCSASTFTRPPVAYASAVGLSSEPADRVCASSASASVTSTSTVSVTPFATVRSAMGATTGRALPTVTPNTTALDVAFGPPLSSVAVTAIVVEPRSSPVRISRVPVADTVATTVSVDVAVSVCTSRASASVTSTCTVDVAPVGTVQSAIAATAGGLFGTVAVNVAGVEVAFDSPLSSVAHTVTVVVPRPTPISVGRPSRSPTPATARSVDVAVSACVSRPSASVTSTPIVDVAVGACMSPSTTNVDVAAFDTMRSAIASNTGRLFCTVAVNVRAADAAFGASLSSVARTVTVAVPRPTPRTVTRFPVTDTVATDVSSDVAVTVCVSPASASVTVTTGADVEPFDTSMSAIAATAGRLFGTVAVNVAGADVAFDAPLSSVAFTVIVAVPRPTPRTVIRFPVTVTVATDVSLDTAISVSATPPHASSVTVTSRVAVEPFATSMPVIGPTTGRSFGTVAVNVRAAEVAFHAPLSSVACTVTVAVPHRPSLVAVEPFSTSTSARPAAAAHRHPLPGHRHRRHRRSYPFSMPD